MNREGIKEVSAAAASGQMDVVLIKSLSCLGRDMLPTLVYVQQLNQWGVEATFAIESTIKTIASNGAVSHITENMQI